MRTRQGLFCNGGVLSVLSVLLILTGCALGGPAIKSRMPPQLPPRAHIAQVPFFPQQAYQCGPAALAMSLRYSGVVVSPDDLTDQVYLPGRKGSLQSALVASARRHGRLAYPIQGMACLLGEVAAGNPVLILQNLGIAWLPRWHYAVINGYDLNRNLIEMHSGLIADRQVGLTTFERTWRRAEYWGLLVLPVDRIPACAIEQTYLKAALGLQQAGAVKEAAQAFETAATRWPESGAAQIGLGNALYALDDLNGAVRALGRASQLDPLNGPAFNNLAHVLAELGQVDAAETAAHRALELGGPQIELFRQTLEEIQRRKAQSMAEPADASGN